MWYLILIALIILIPITYIYFKFFRTEPKNFFVFVVSQLTISTSLFYVVPVKRIIFVDILGVGLPDSPDILVYLTFVIGLIAITYLFVKYEAQKASKIIDKQTELADLKDSSAQEKKEAEATSHYKMRKPHEFDEESGLFYERVKRIFLLYRGCDLAVDVDNEILYGEINYLGENTPIFVKCDSSGSKTVNYKDFLNWIDRYYDRKQMDADHKKVFYIHLDSVTDLPDSNEITVWSETQLIVACFPVKAYLNSLICRYKHDELPFSIREEGQKFSLADTFVPPSFNHTELGTDKSLESFLNQWLNEDKSPRQMAILGGYGMGKSSFLLHYAAQLAENYVPGKTRIPVLIPLTNVSPMHDVGLKDRLSKTAEDMGIRYASLLYLIEKQQVVLLLDGFDEMGYVGSREHRLQHFESIWQLATKGNKIIIAGRPSYFFGEQELNKALQAVDKKELISDDLPHCRLIELHSLSAEDIEAYLHKYFSAADVSQYLGFIQSHQQLFDLAARPSLMHMIREMIGEIYADQQQQFSAATLMEKYVHHWIIRQDKKKITGSLSKEDKPKFFEQLAEWFYLNETEVIEPSKVEELMQEFLEHFDFTDKDTKDGILGDLLSGSFLQRQASNHYKFVHRSFFEYFVAKSIVFHIGEKNAENEFPEIFFKLWRQEITAFVADLSPRGALPLNLEENNFYGQSKSLFRDLSQVELERKQPVSGNIFNRLFFNFTSQLKKISLKNELRKFSKILVSKNGDYIIIEKHSTKTLIDNSFFGAIIFAISAYIFGVATFIISGGIFSLFLSLMILIGSWEAINRTLIKITNTSSQLIQLFKTALINDINVRFYQKKPTKTFINDALFIFLKKYIFTKSGALTNHDFSGWNLENVDLSEANLQGANFSNANLRNVNFHNANLRNVNFKNADLTGANLENAKLEGANFEGSKGI